jgi:hypothetical protein
MGLISHALFILGIRYRDTKNYWDRKCLPYDTPRGKIEPKNRYHPTLRACLIQIIGVRLKIFVPIIPR